MHYVPTCLRAYVPYVPMRLTCLRAIVLQITRCLRAFRTYVPYVPTCLRALNYYVPTCLKLLRAYMFEYLHFSRAYVLTCVYIFFMPTCLCALNYFVPTCAHFSRAYVPTITHKIYWGSLLYLVLLFFSELFDLSFHSKPQNKLLLLKLHTPTLSCGGFFISSTAYTETKI